LLLADNHSVRTDSIIATVINIFCILVFSIHFTIFWFNCHINQHQLSVLRSSTKPPFATYQQVCWSRDYSSGSWLSWRSNRVWNGRYRRWRKTEVRSDFSNHQQLQLGAQLLEPGTTDKDDRLPKIVTK